MTGLTRHEDINVAQPSQTHLETGNRRNRKKYESCNFSRSSVLKWSAAMKQLDGCSARLSASWESGQVILTTSRQQAGISAGSNKARLQAAAATSASSGVING